MTKMLFLQCNINYKLSTNSTSLALIPNATGNKTPEYFRYPLIKSFMVQQDKKVVRRVSLSSLPQAKGSMTLEAALVLSLFIFFILNLYSIIEMLRFHGNMELAIRQVGNEMSVYGYAYHHMMEEGDNPLNTLVGKLAFSNLYIRQKIEEYLGEEYIQYARVENGKNGIWFWEVSLMENDIISFTVTYRLKLPFTMGNLAGVRLKNSYYSRAWTGYEVENEDTYVFLAETGTVYHIRRDCTYIMLNIKEANPQVVFFIRNIEGEKYTECERCQNKGSPIWFITESGNKYHYTLECSALKRTIRQVTLEEALEKNYDACSRCGKTKGEK